MARKITDITHSASRYDILSQTPKNHSEDNYFLKELQEKIIAEWEYRPNRADVEYETRWGEQEWSPLEVVVQSVKSEKGSAISDDCKNLVFRNLSEDRFQVGSRFRFSPDHDLGAADEEKNVWITTNMNRAKMTRSVVVERCNGILGSTYVDSQGVTRFHYEPVIQGKDLSAVSMFYNETAVSPQSQLLVTAQYNRFTRAYKINQRFIVGARYYDDAKGEWVGQVYRVKAINRFYSNQTSVPENVGLLRIYLELTESGAYDDWENRIAYQQEPTVRIDEREGGQSGKKRKCFIAFKTPDVIPTGLTSAPIVFTPVVRDETGKEYPEASRAIVASWSLDNLPPGADGSKFVDFRQANDAAGTTFEISRKKVYLNGDIRITCALDAESSPSGEALDASFGMTMRQQEA